MLTRVTDRKIPCVCIHVNRIIKIEDLVCIILYVTLIIEGIFRVLSKAKLKGSANVLLGEGGWKIWTCSCWEKDNFITINEFKYGKT